MFGLGCTSDVVNEGDSPASEPIPDLTYRIILAAGEFLFERLMLDAFSCSDFSEGTALCRESAGPLLG